MKKWLLLAIAPYLFFLMFIYGPEEWQIIAWLIACCNFATAASYYDKTFKASERIENETLREIFLAPYSISAIFLYSMGVIPPPTKLTL
jgi:hypothetical protein